MKTLRFIWFKVFPTAIMIGIFWIVSCGELNAENFEEEGDEMNAGKERNLLGNTISADNPVMYDPQQKGIDLVRLVEYDDSQASIHHLTVDYYSPSGIYFDTQRRLYLNFGNGGHMTSMWVDLRRGLGVNIPGSFIRARVAYRSPPPVPYPDEVIGASLVKGSIGYNDQLTVTELHPNAILPGGTWTVIVPPFAKSYIIGAVPTGTNQIQVDESDVSGNTLNRILIYQTTFLNSYIENTILDKTNSITIKNVSANNFNAASIIFKIAI